MKIDRMVKVGAKERSGNTIKYQDRTELQAGGDRFQDKERHQGRNIQYKDSDTIRLADRAIVKKDD
jgi:hypothetical protein